MKTDPTDLLPGIVNRLLREPERTLPIDLRRSAAMLASARPDATARLLQRVLELETAMLELRTAFEAAQGREPASAGIEADPGAVPAAGARASPGRPALRDAAVVAAGVVGGGLVLAGLDALFDGDDAAPDDGLF
jgi:hypothetical protein